MRYNPCAPREYIAYSHIQHRRADNKPFRRGRTEDTPKEAAKSYFKKHPNEKLCHVRRYEPVRYGAIPFETKNPLYYAVLKSAVDVIPWIKM